MAHELTYHWYWMSFAHSATAATAGDVPAPAVVRPAASSDLSTATTACLCTAAVLPTAGQCATPMAYPAQPVAAQGLSVFISPPVWWWFTKTASPPEPPLLPGRTIQLRSVVGGRTVRICNDGHVDALGAGCVFYH